jgi:hypothetical protein
MENRDRTSNQGEQGQGNKPGQGGQQGGREGQGGSQKPGQGGSQQGGREGQGGSQTPGQGGGKVGQHGARDGQIPGEEYLGERRGMGGIPKPEERQKVDSVHNFRGTADVDYEEEDENEQNVGPMHDPGEDLNGQHSRK